jgi:hypothetical protein
MKYRRRIWILTLMSALLLGSGTLPLLAHAPGSQVEPAAKIAFDLNQLNADGLYGPPGGLRALDYEFCIPADPACEAQVKALDPTILIVFGSKGRIGCRPEEYLCIGNTHQPEYKRVLLSLASLPFIMQIRQCFFE